MGPMSFDFDGFVGLRLNEHAFHTWDIDVVLDQKATIPVPVAHFVVDNLELVGRYTAKPTAGDPPSSKGSGPRTPDPDLHHDWPIEDPPQPSRASSAPLINQPGGCPQRRDRVIARDGAVVAGWSMARARTLVVAAASALAIAGATGCSSDDSSSDGTVDRSSPSTTDAVSSLTASTRPVGTSTTTGATTSEPTLSTTTTSPRPVPFDDLEIVVYPVPAGSRPHDVAPAADGGVWYTAQRAGALGHLDPASGRTRHIALGEGPRRTA